MYDKYWGSLMQSSPFLFSLLLLPCFMFTVLYWYNVWRPLFISGLLDSYLVQSQTPSKVSPVLVYKGYLSCPIWASRVSCLNSILFLSTHRGSCRWDLQGRNLYPISMSKYIGGCDSYSKDISIPIRESLMH